jgi:hypothetical protein
MTSKVMSMSDWLEPDTEKESTALRGSRKTTGEVESNIGDTYAMSGEIETLFENFKDPKTKIGDRKTILKKLFAHNNHKYSTKLIPEKKKAVVSEYLKDFQQFMRFLNTDDNKQLIFTTGEADMAKLREIGENKLTVRDILTQASGTPNKLIQGIRDNYLKDDSPFTVFKTYDEIGKQKRTPSKKPTEPPILSPDEKLEQDIAKAESEIKKLRDDIKTTTNKQEKDEMRVELDVLKKELSELEKNLEIEQNAYFEQTASDIVSNSVAKAKVNLMAERKAERKASNPMGNVRTKVTEIEKKEKDKVKTEEDEKEDDPPRRPPRMYEPPSSPRTAPPAAPIPPPPPVQPPPAAPIPTPPPSPRTATKQDEEKGRPQDPTAIDTMQPLPSKSDLIPEARLGTKGKDINDLIDDIKYFMDNFEGQLKREKGFFKNVDIRNIKELRELHDRIVGKLAPEKRKSTDGNKVGIIVNADDYIREQMKKILQEQTFSSLRPADVVIDVGSRAVEGRDAKDFGDFEVKRTIDGGLSSQREAVYRYMPNENDRGEEALTMKKKSNRIKMPKPGLNNKRTTAIRMNTRNPFRGSQNTIKLKYLY